MFDPASRYYKTEQGTLMLRADDGQLREVRFVRRRFIPAAEGAVTLAEYTVAQGDRLDNLTARFFGDPTQFWQLCDANGVLLPEELEAAGRVIRIVLSNT